MVPITIRFNQVGAVHTQKCIKNLKNHEKCSTLSLLGHPVRQIRIFPDITYSSVSSQYGLDSYFGHHRKS